ncbi:MAG TPA: type II toxin-antitoxin system HicB family antitoxin [Terriglobia bacterium]|nr:type II toxin-antitoxin system HicB family antitoxin [Terriglobia bacterium]
MINLQYSLIVEATDDPNFFGFYSPELEGFTGVDNSIEGCLYKARWGMEEHAALLRQRGLPVPAAPSDLKIVIQNEKPAVASKS